MSDAPQTRPCPDCASPVRTVDQSFCDSCGAFLRWDTPAGAAATADRPAQDDTASAAARPTPAGAPADVRSVPASGSASDQASGSASGATHGSASPESAGREEPGAATGADTAPGASRGAGAPAGPEVQGVPDAPATSAGGTATSGAGTSAGASGSAGPSGPPGVGPEEVTAPLPAVTASPEAQAPASAPTSAPAAVPEARASSDGPSDTLVRALLVPVPGNRPAEPAVAAPVLPARPEAARPAVRAAEAAVPVQGGTPCPACSLANTPGRHFCRFCATPMVPERLSDAEGPYAGRRPGLARDRSRWIVRALIATAVVAVVVGGIVGGPPAARAVQDHFATRVPVHPVSWAASHSAAKRDPKLAGDGYSNTWWGTGYAGDSAGQYLEATFAEPTDLLSLLITPGSSKNTTQADGQATPRTFDLVVRDSSGETHVSHHRINDGGTQRVDLRVRDALSVRLVLATAWRADPRKQVAVAELEFFGRSVS
ncbi:NADase-type glycan-binding domain-containing protein [Streptomyces sp. LMG1-1-1.1]|uniref:NADase-type glycan-binding domain-containing protein n=1 Tax=Streptomyces sp. LMG1-1-1.1 TaxID=3135245 RepID=UPI0034652B21